MSRARTEAACFAAAVSDLQPGRITHLSGTLPALRPLVLHAVAAQIVQRFCYDLPDNPFNNAANSEADEQFFEAKQDLMSAFAAHGLDKDLLDALADIL